MEKAIVVTVVAVNCFLAASAAVKVPLFRTLRVYDAGWVGVQLDLLKTRYGDVMATGKSLPLANYENTQYYGPISLVDHLHTVNALFDTGSSNFYIPPKNCSPAITSKPRYEDEEIVSREVTVIVADLTVLNQVALETNMCPNVTAQWSAIVGMSLQPEGGATPLFINMVKQGVVSEPVFGLWLNRNEEDSENGGELFLGGVNHALYEGELYYIPIAEGPFWQIKMEGVTIGSGPTSFCSHGCDAILDSGSAVILGPMNEVKKLNEQLGAKQIMDNTFVFDCSNMENLPDVMFAVGGRHFAVSQSDYVIKSVNSTFCLSGFWGLELPSDMPPRWVLGEIFIGTYYVAFDVGRRSVGIARAK